MTRGAKLGAGKIVIFAILVGVIALVTVTLAPAARLRGGEAVCGWTGGKWASELGRCVTRRCYAEDDCGFWAHPVTRCRYLKIGDPIEEIYFQLGAPNRVDLNKYAWFSKGNFGVEPDITADISRGKLISLKCR